ncbi:unnamed protein product [Rotaria sordida]|uniref:Reverse transcriptase/retrotransposon-derived protein RNase H-like domain-containing protein n=1 Tax=Rotaria sordida TaxID=392033 RepID=A0A820FEC5_9BILA|nr:unnamed protein product [Rotaria sordida]
MFYQWGLTKAPPSFQRTMDNSIDNNREQYCLVCPDDIIIFSKTFKDELNHLNEILNILDKHRHSISEYGITSIHDNIKAIRELQLSDHLTLKQANEFIGELGFYRRFIKNFSKITLPIYRVTNLTKNNKHNFKWHEEQRQAIQQLKEIITGAELVLDFPGPDLQYKLSTNASNVGLGAVFKEVPKDRRIKIIYYLLCALSKNESRYSTTELEALAMM